MYIVAADPERNPRPSVDVSMDIVPKGAERGSNKEIA
jgi:hypothetical protein